MIKLAIPSIDEADLAAVREALLSLQLVQGPRVLAFEERMAALVGTRHAVAVANCTAALHLALLVLGVGPGDKVAVTTYSWPATANVIALVGAEPVFVEIEPTTCGMDPRALEAVLAQHRVRAILPVHAFGGMAALPELLELAARHGVPLIEDAACALGTTLHGRQAGSFGVMGCFSFHPRKAVTTGEGGVITTDDAGLARQLKILRNHGLDPDAATPDFVMPGYNLRMTEFQAALGLTQLDKLERLIAARQELAGRYAGLLAGTPVTPPGALAGSEHVYQSYVVLLPADAAPRRVELIAAMREAGIETTIGTYHMPLIRHFRERYGFGPGAFPVTDDVAGRAMSLPLFEGMTPEQQALVVRTLVGLLERVVA